MPTPVNTDEAIRWTIDVRRRLHRYPDLTGEEEGAQRIVLSMLDEEAPDAYKNIDQVVDVTHESGISRKVARLVPMGVMKG
jgi:tRNA-splicing ligase RtcB